MLLHYRCADWEPLVKAMGLTWAAEQDIFNPPTILLTNIALRQWLAIKLTEINGVAFHLDISDISSYLDRLHSGQTFQRNAYQWNIYRVLQTQPELWHEIRSGFHSLPSSDDQVLLKQKLLFSKKMGDIFRDYQFYRPEIIQAWLDNQPETFAPAWQRKLFNTAFAQVKTSDTFHLTSLLLNTTGTDLIPNNQAPILVMVDKVQPPWFYSTLARLAKHTQVHVFSLTPTQDYFDNPYQSDQITSAHSSLMDSPRESQTSQILSAAGVWSLDHLKAMDELNPKADIQLESSLSQANQASQKDLEPKKTGLAHWQEALSTIGKGALSEVAPTADGKPRKSGIELVVSTSKIMEVEKTRDWIMHHLQQDPSLLPGDFLVVSDNIEAYLPDIHAVFPPNDAQVPWSYTGPKPVQIDQPLAFFVDCLDKGTEQWGFEYLQTLALCPASLQALAMSSDDWNQVVEGLHSLTQGKGFYASHSDISSQPNSSLHKNLLLWLRKLLSFDVALPAPQIPVNHLIKTLNFFTGWADISKQMDQQPSLAQWLDIVQSLKQLFQPISQEGSFYQAMPHQGIALLEQTLTNLISELDSDLHSDSHSDSHSDLEPQSQVCFHRQDIAAMLKPQAMRSFRSYFLGENGLQVASFNDVRGLSFKHVAILGQQSSPATSFPDPLDALAKQPQAWDPDLRIQKKHNLLLQLATSSHSVRISRVEQRNSVSFKPFISQLMTHQDLASTQASLLDYLPDAPGGKTFSQRWFRNQIPQETSKDFEALSLTSSNLVNCLVSLNHPSNSWFDRMASSARVMAPAAIYSHHHPWTRLLEWKYASNADLRSIPIKQAQDAWLLDNGHYITLKTQDIQSKYQHILNSDQIKEYSVNHSRHLTVPVAIDPQRLQEKSDVHINYTFNDLQHPAIDALGYKSKPNAKDLLRHWVEHLLSQALLKEKDSCIRYLDSEVTLQAIAKEQATDYLTLITMLTVWQEQNIILSPSSIVQANILYADKTIDKDFQAFIEQISTPVPDQTQKPTISLSTHLGLLKKPLNLQLQPPGLTFHEHVGIYAYGVINPLGQNLRIKSL